MTSAPTVPHIVSRPHGTVHEKIGALQVLRFLAATLVMIGHFQQEIIAAVPRRTALYGFVPLDWGLGVDIFFVISGFVMFYLSFDNFGKPGAPGHFMRRRLIRIVPLYWLFTSIVLAMALATSGMTGGEPLYLPNIIASYLFLPGPRCGEYCFPVYTLGWTLNYEMLFYLLVAISLHFTRRLGVAFIILSICALMIARVLTPPSLPMIHFWGLSMVGEFLLGMAICHLFIIGTTFSRTVAAIGIVGGVILAVIFYQTQSYAILWRLITGGLPAALIVGGVVLAWRSLPASRLTRFLIGGGDSSYALYLVHPFVAKAMALIFRKLGLWSVEPWLFLIVSVPVAIAASFVIHHYGELPVTRWLSTRWGRPAVSREQAA